MGSDHDEPGQAGHAGLAGAEAFFRGMASPRSVIAFTTMFSWAGALYLASGRDLVPTLGISALWGLAGSAIVAGLLLAIRRLSVDRRATLGAVVGQEARVYLDIPAGGPGEVRMMVDGRLQHVRAVCAGPRRLAAGARVVVTGLASPHTVEVVALDELLTVTSGGGPPAQPPSSPSSLSHPR